MLSFLFTFALFIFFVVVICFIASGIVWSIVLLIEIILMPFTENKKK